MHISFSRDEKSSPAYVNNPKKVNYTKMRSNEDVH